MTIVQVDDVLSIPADLERSDPSTWPSWTDEVWTLGAEGPTAEDLAELADESNAAAAREYLNPADATLDLAGLVEHQATFYRAWPSEAGEMIALAMDELALKIRMTEATTPAELEARVQVLDDEVRADWEAIGYEAGRASCPCHDYTA